MKKYIDIGVYDFSDYAEEITWDALFKINGGAQIENSIEAQANAKVGDTVTREDGTTHTLYKGDIDWAQKEMAKKETKTPASGSSNNTSTVNISTGNTASNSSHNQSVVVSNGPTTITEKKAPSPAIMYDSHDPSRVFVDLDNPKAMQQAADLLADPSLGLRVTAYGRESGITKNFKNYQEINDYLNGIENITNQLEQDESIPIAPSFANLEVNIERAKTMSPIDFYKALKNKGEWDYKQYGKEYEDFGNFNFGATGAAIFPENILKRGAGWAQTQAGTSKKEWGKWFLLAPYGDDPKDQIEIQKGIDYYKNNYIPKNDFKTSQEQMMWLYYQHH